MTYEDYWRLIAWYAAERIRLLAQIEAQLDRAPQARTQMYRLLKTTDQLFFRDFVERYVIGNG